MDAVINSLLERLLATSLQTTLLATAVWTLCRFVPRLSPSSQCWLWWLVALQAVLGLVVSPIEFRLLQYAQGVLPETFAGMPWATALPDAPALQPSPGPATGHMWLTWQSAAFLLWTSGFLTMAWFTLREWQRGEALVNGSTACDDGALLQALVTLARTSGTRKPPELRLSADIESPLLIGHRRPVLLLPTRTSMSNDELDMVLAHELTHLRRGDLWWGVIPALARHLFFFHPLAHLATREYGIAREAACDAGVMDTGQRSRQDYGRLLVRLGTSRVSRMGLAVNSPTFQSLQRRLFMLQRTSFLSRTLSIALLVVVAATGVLPVRLVAAAAPSAASQTGPSATVPDTASQSATSSSTPGKVRLEANSLKTQIAQTEERLWVAPTRRDDAKQRNAGVSAKAGRGTPGELRFSYVTCRITPDGKETPKTLGSQSSESAALRRMAQDCQQLNVPVTKSGVPGGAVAALIADDYGLKVGDALQISVWQQPDLSTDLPVRPDGKISSPFVENMPAAGKTPSQLARDMEAVLSKFFRAPKVTVIVK